MAKPTTEIKVRLEIGHGAPTTAQRAMWRNAWKALSAMPWPAPEEAEAVGDGKATERAETKEGQVG